MSFAGPACADPFDPAAWLADLEQARQAFHEKYGNLDWLEGEREVGVDKVFEDLAKRMSRARNEAQAISVFNRLVRKTGDGHVAVEWPEPTAAATTSGAVKPDLCGSIGYDQRQNEPGTAQALPGYTKLASTGSPFEAGTLIVGDTKLGIVRIGVFQPQGYPELCRAAVHELAVPANKPCDDECQNSIVTLAYRDLTVALEQRLKELEAAGATTLLVDVTNNGGGSEWAEAAARMFSSRQLVSERRGFVRGEHWAR